jgi:prepilin-type N-terminal cleavage/methylation domain-containing protein
MTLRNFVPSFNLSRWRARSSPSRRARANTHRNQAGLTLIEVMVATVLGASACFAGLAGLLTSLRTADSNLLSLQAASAVRSVSEQMLSVDYLSLFSANLPVDVPSQPGGSLKAGDWNSRTDDFRHTPDNPNDDLQLRIRPSVTRIIQADGVDFAQVVLQYEWQDSTFFAARTRSDTFTMLVTSVSSY